MEEKINLIEKELRDGILNNNPHLCAEYVASLCGELSFYLSKQGEIEQNRAKNWLEIRKEHKSDTATTKAWSLTEDGISYEWYENRIKRIKALLTGLRSLLKMAELEIHNI